MEDNHIEQFAEALISDGHALANDRIKRSSIPSKKYLRLRDFVQILVFNCYSMTINLYNNGEIEKKHFSSVFFEYLDFFIYLIDSQAFSLVGDPKRFEFMGELVEFAMELSIQALFPELADDAKDNIYKQCMNNLNSVAQEYKKYKIISNEDEPTALFEVSKRIQQFTADPHNLGAIVGHEYVIRRTLTRIDIQSFLLKMK